jgi:hypothetical protein
MNNSNSLTKTIHQISSELPTNANRIVIVI